MNKGSKYEDIKWTKKIKGSDKDEIKESIIVMEEIINSKPYKEKFGIKKLRFVSKYKISSSIKNFLEKEGIAFKIDPNIKEIKRKRSRLITGCWAIKGEEKI